MKSRLSSHLTTTSSPQYLRAVPSFACRGIALCPRKHCLTPAQAFGKTPAALKKDALPYCLTRRAAKADAARRIARKSRVSFPSCRCVHFHPRYNDMMSVQAFCGAPERPPSRVRIYSKMYARGPVFPPEGKNIGKKLWKDLAGRKSCRTFAIAFGTSVLPQGRPLSSAASSSGAWFFEMIP